MPSPRQDHAKKGIGSAAENRTTPSVKYIVRKHEDLDSFKITGLLVDPGLRVRILNESSEK